MAHMKDCRPMARSDAVEHARSLKHWPRLTCCFHGSIICTAWSKASSALNLAGTYLGSKLAGCAAPNETKLRSKSNRAQTSIAWIELKGNVQACVPAKSEYGTLHLVQAFPLNKLVKS